MFMISCRILTLHPHEKSSVSFFIPFYELSIRGWCAGPVKLGSMPLNWHKPLHCAILGLGACIYHNYLFIEILRPQWIGLLDAVAYTDHVNGPIESGMYVGSVPFLFSSSFFFLLAPSSVKVGSTNRFIVSSLLSTGN